MSSSLHMFLDLSLQFTIRLHLLITGMTIPQFILKCPYILEIVVDLCETAGFTNHCLCKQQFGCRVSLESNICRGGFRYSEALRKEQF